MKREDFFGEYCIQLRRECESIRCEINRFLYFALVILGAMGFAMVRGEEARQFIRQAVAIPVELAALIAITSLFWLRRLHIQQLADRWYIIRGLAAREFDGGKMTLMHEAVACERIERTKGRAYVRQEWVLNAAFSLPIYVLLVASGFAEADASFLTPLRAFSVGIVVLHFWLSYVLLYQRAKLTNPLLSKGTEVEKAEKALEPTC